MSQSISILIQGGRCLYGTRLVTCDIGFSGDKITHTGEIAVTLADHIILPGVVDICAPGGTQASPSVTTRYEAVTLPLVGHASLASPADPVAPAQTSRHARTARLVICETHRGDAASMLHDAIAAGSIDALAVVDSLPDALWRAQNDAEATLARASELGMAAGDYVARLKKADQQAPLVPRFLCGLADVCDRYRIPFLSVHDRDGSTRDYLSMLGAMAVLSPQSYASAAVAHTLEHGVVVTLDDMTAETARGQLATHLLSQSHALAVASGYQAPGDLLSWACAQAMGDATRLAELWPMISTHPASVMRLTRRGSLMPGAQADFVVLSPDLSHLATITGGRLTFVAPEMGNEFVDVFGDTGAPVAA